MYLIPVILLIAVAGMWVTRKTLPPMAGRVLAVLVVLLSIVWVVALLRPRSGTTGKPDAVFEEARGYRAGQWIAEKVQGGGTVVYLDSPGGSDADRLRQEARVRGLEQALADGTFEVELVELTAQDVADTLGGISLPASLITRTAEAYAPCAAVVLGQAVPIPDSRRRPRSLPPVLSLTDPDPPVRNQAFMAGLLNGVVMQAPKADLEARPSRGAALDEVFAMRYQWIATNAP